MGLFGGFQNFTVSIDNDLGRESMRILSNISLYTQPIHRNMLNFDRLFCQKDLLVCVLTAEAVLSTIIIFFRHILNI